VVKSRILSPRYAAPSSVARGRRSRPARCDRTCRDEPGHGEGRARAVQLGPRWCLAAGEHRDAERGVHVLEVHGTASDGSTPRTGGIAATTTGDAIAAGEGDRVVCAHHVAGEIGESADRHLHCRVGGERGGGRHRQLHPVGPEARLAEGDFRVIGGDLDGAACARVDRLREDDADRRGRVDLGRSVAGDRGDHRRRDEIHLAGVAARVRAGVGSAAVAGAGIGKRGGTVVVTTAEHERREQHGGGDRIALCKRTSRRSPRGRQSRRTKAALTLVV
jgi:hypothetical protein